MLIKWRWFVVSPYTVKEQKDCCFYVIMFDETPIYCACRQQAIEIANLLNCAYTYGKLEGQMEKQEEK
jgi:hypothetical protein